MNDKKYHSLVHIEKICYGRIIYKDKTYEVSWLIQISLKFRWRSRSRPPFENDLDPDRDHDRDHCWMIVDLLMDNFVDCYKWWNESLDMISIMIMRASQSVVFNTGQKMALRAFHFIRTLTKALTYYFINRTVRNAIKWGSVKSISNWFLKVSNVLICSLSLCNSYDDISFLHFCVFRSLFEGPKISVKLKHLWLINLVDNINVHDFCGLVAAWADFHPNVSGSIPYIAFMLLKHEKIELIFIYRILHPQNFFFQIFWTCTALKKSSIVK